MNAAQRYNAGRAGSLWLVDDLPLALQASGHPGSEPFARWVEGWQRNHHLTADGKLGPNTWRAMRSELFDPPQADPPAPALDRRVDSRIEAGQVLASGLRLSPHLREEAEAILNVLSGRRDKALAWRVLRAARRDGQIMVANIIRRGGADARELYAHKGRTAEQMRSAYLRWHDWISDSKRHGLGVHWSAGNGDADRLADYLIRRRPGRVSTNIVTGYDGSTVILFPAVADPELGDDRTLFTAHGAHNPGCIGYDFTSPGFLERRGGAWYARNGSRMADEVIDACGVVTLDDLDLRSWSGEPTPECPWIYRKGREGRVWSVRHFLAPTWQQLAMFLVIGRAMSIVYQWTRSDLVVVGHYQRSTTRADPFHYPLRWLRDDILRPSDALHPDGWLARINPEEVDALINEYRRSVVGTGW